MKPGDEVRVNYLPDNANWAAEHGSSKAKMEVGDVITLVELPEKLAPFFIPQDIQDRHDLDLSDYSQWAAFMSEPMCESIIPMKWLEPVVEVIPGVCTCDIWKGCTCGVMAAERAAASQREG
jgi:hypothetical protein